MKKWTLGSSSEDDLPHIQHPPFHIKDYAGHIDFFYFTEYISRGGYHSHGNQIITNFKMQSDGLSQKINPQRLPHRDNAIEEMGVHFSYIINDLLSFYYENEERSAEMINEYSEYGLGSYDMPHLLLTHTPPSSDDNRFLLLTEHILDKIKHKEGNLVNSIMNIPDLFIRGDKQSKSKSNEGRTEQDYERFFQLLTVNGEHKQLLQESKMILIIDDVLVSGMQFKACCERVREVNSEIEIFGVFYAKAITQNINDNTQEDESLNP